NYEKSARHKASQADNGSADAGTAKVATIRLTLRIENNSKFVRGKKRAREDIGRKQPSCRPIDPWVSQLPSAFRPKHLRAALDAEWLK
ncbi:resolvase domain-containing protein, partial [mine drainage metagenome]